MEVTLTKPSEKLLEQIKEIVQSRGHLVTYGGIIEVALSLSLNLLSGEEEWTSKMLQKLNKLN